MSSELQPPSQLKNGHLAVTVNIETSIKAEKVALAYHKCSVNIYAVGNAFIYFFNVKHLSDIKGHLMNACYPAGIPIDNKVLNICNSCMHINNVQFFVHYVYMYQSLS